jgi:hypothetical protein
MSLQMAFSHERAHDRSHLAGTILASSSNSALEAGDIVLSAIKPAA